MAKSILELVQDANKAMDMMSLDELESYAYVRCPMCDNENNRFESHLGQLGNIDHYRCRYCGVNFNERIDR